ncbi:hypothetical protein M153_25200011616 [Pseudoloma neurophilia]|uniref:Uncharacterized protein n=1 Tax=Pseudoloma neurophilia TaxID=146866 RepID=A0A0R0LYR3_9MICR|nr:hypothetical protein M153_25200011616 [Pseudoloma neurophilia]
MAKRLETNQPLSTTALLKQNKTSNRIKSLMNSNLQPFYITPVQVLILSLFFIGTVFILHLYARFSPGTSSLQMIVAVAVFLISIFVSYELNKRF